MSAASKRRSLRTIEVDAPAWADGKTVMREPSYREFREASKIEDYQERVAALLGLMVLDEEGQSVGIEAIESAGAVAVAQLARKMAPLIGEEEEDAPLGTTTGSSTDSASPSVG